MSSASPLLPLSHSPSLQWCVVTDVSLEQERRDMLRVRRHEAEQPAKPGEKPLLSETVRITRGLLGMERTCLDLLS